MISIGFPSGYLDLAQAYSVLSSSIQHGKIQGSDIEKNRTQFVVSPLLMLCVYKFKNTTEKYLWLLILGLSE